MTAPYLRSRDLPALIPGINPVLLREPGSGEAELGLSFAIAAHLEQRRDVERERQRLKMGGARGARVLRLSSAIAEEALIRQRQISELSGHPLPDRRAAALNPPEPGRRPHLTLVSG